VTIWIGIWSSLVAVLAVAACAAVVRGRLAAAAEVRDASDGEGLARSGCPHCVSGYAADVGFSCPVHAGSVDGSDGDVRPTATGTCSWSGMGGTGEVVTDPVGGGVDLGAAGAVAHEWALDRTMVSSIGDDLTVDGLFYTYPPRPAPAAQKPSDTMPSSRSSGANVRLVLFGPHGRGRPGA